MKKIKNYFEKLDNRIFLVSFLVVMFVACSKLFSRYCINGHDLEYHLLRIEALKEGIQMGRPFLKVNVLFFGGAGYASSMFYPDFLLYIPALLRVIGVSINSSFHIFVFICILLCYISTYYSVKGISKNKYAGIIAASIITLCNYHLEDIFVRSAVGEYTAFIFIPLIIYGIYNTVYEEMSKPQILGIGFLGVLLCHTLSFAICAFITVVVFVINIKKFIRNPKIIVKLVCTAILSASLACAYWLPMLEQFLKDSFYVNKDQWVDMSLGAMQLSNGFSYIFPSLGFAVVLFCIPVFLIKGSEKSDSIKYSEILVLGSFLLILISSDLFPWKRLGKYLSMVQFPWRFYLVVSVCLSMAAGVILTKIASSVRLTKFVVFTDKSDGKNITESLFGRLVLFIAILTMSITAFNSLKINDTGYYDYSNDYYSYVPFTANVIAGEWLPQRVESIELLLEQSEHVISNEGNDVPFERSKNEVVVYTDREYEYVDVPLVYYNGYSAKGADGNNLECDGNGTNGLTRVYLNGYNGQVTISYKGTNIQRIARIVTVISAVFLIVLFVLNRRRYKS